MKREPVTRLDPLTASQAKFLFDEGSRIASAVRPDPDSVRHEVWWLSYYSAARTNSYEDQGFDVSNASEFNIFKKDLESSLQSAKKDPSVFKEMARQGRLPPPDPPRPRRLRRAPCLPRGA